MGYFGVATIMRRYHPLAVALASLAVVAAGAIVHAAGPAPANNAAPAGGVIVSEPHGPPPAACCHEPAPCCAPAAAAAPALPPTFLYGSVEALFWWTKSVPVAPLVTINADRNRIAALNEPGTRVLFGGAANDIDFRNVAGLRGTLGFWLPENVIGIEGSLFGLPEQCKDYTARAGGLDGPVIGVPFNSLVPFLFNPAGETSLNPGNTPSQIAVNYSTELWGAEVLGMANLLSDDNCRLVLVGGFKYLNLEENLSVSQLFLDTLFPGTLTVRDHIGTRNQFYGLALGLRAGYTLGCVGFDIGGKIAVGPNRQQYSINGTTTAVGSAFGIPPGVYPAGLFGQPSNNGEYCRNTFTIVPEVQGRVTVALCRNVQVFAAYDYLYINDVVRAASQVDRNLNATQNPVFGVPTGVPAPVSGFNRTDYWAQGISGGMQFRY